MELFSSFLFGILMCDVIGLMLTLILCIPLLRFDLCVMLTFRSELHWGLGGNCEVRMVFAVLT